MERLRPKRLEGFQPGHEKVGGRKAGTPNKVTVGLKAAIVAAAEKVGNDNRGKDGLIGYLAHLAWREPQVYGRLLEKVLPHILNIKEDWADRKVETLKDLSEALRERGLPPPHKLIDITPNSRDKEPTHAGPVSRQ